jgi:hypothetical protein
LTVSTRTERVLLGAILALALAVRLFLLLGPYSEIDADEAVVGLMALQIPGELPAFYWEQHYLGTIETFAARAVFALIGPSAAALKLVPALFSVAFIWMVYLAARPVFGPAPALLSALYLAVPPSFFAAWSVKARGGYAEALAFGELFLVASLHLAHDEECAKRVTVWAPVAGLAGGLALWTHPFAIVFLGAGGLYLLLAWRSNVRGRQVTRIVGVAAAGFCLGLAPAIVHNVTQGLPSFQFAAESGTEPGAALLNTWGLMRYGLPVLVGLAQGTPTREVLLQDWPHRPGSNWLVTVALPLIGLGIVWAYRRSLTALVRGMGDIKQRGPALFAILLLLVPPFVAVSRFAHLWAEPRYALPIYGAVPLVAGLIWRARTRGGLPVALLAGALIGLNLFSLVTSDERLALPTSAGDSTAANRAVLIDYLLAHDVERIYTDYWLAYPIAFESRERIVPAVWSGGFSRRASYSHLVFIADDPAFVFARGTPGDDDFQARLSRLGGTADIADVEIYRVYTHVQPLDRMRNP